MTKQQPSFEVLPETGRLSEASAKRYFSVFGLAVFGMSLVSTVFSYLIAFLTYRFFPAVYESYWFGSVLSVVVIYGCGLPVLLLLLRRLPKQSPEKKKYDFVFPLAALSVCFFATQVGSRVSQWLMNLVGSLMGQEILNPVETSSAGVPIWFQLIFTALLAPVLEELVFRKILCDRLLPLGEGYAVLLSASVFALFHGNFYQLIYAFLGGLCLGYVYIKSGKLRYSIGLHMIINLVFGILPLLVMEQLDTETLYALLENAEALSEAGAEAAYLQELLAILGRLLLPMLGMLFLLKIQGLGTVAGLTVLIVLLVRKRIKLKPGTLPPPAEAKISPIFLNAGVALAIALFAFELVRSLLYF